MRLITTVILAAAMANVSLFSGIQNQDARRQSASVVLAAQRPEYSLEYSSTSKLKLASRKTTYRLGDLMSLDAALINNSDKPIFLRKLSGLSFSARNSVGVKVDVVKYVEISSDVTADSFELVQPGEMITHTAHILIGCDERTLKNTQSMLNTKDDRSIFDRDLFVSWGQGCLDTRRVGTYKLTAEVINEYVVVSSESGKLRTAVGTITSDPLKIIVSK